MLFNHGNLSDDNNYIGHIQNIFFFNLYSDKWK